MKKLLLATTIASTLLLASCGNESDSKENKTNNAKLSHDKQESIYKDETKKLAKAIIKEDEQEQSDDTPTRGEIKKLLDAVKTYEDKTKDLDKVETEIGDYAAKTSAVRAIAADRIVELADYEEKYPDSEESSNLAMHDLLLNVAYVAGTINMDYEDFDIDYKNEYLGKEANEVMTDFLSNVTDDLANERAEEFGESIIAFDEDVSDEQLKILNNTDYRSKLYKYSIKEEPEMSKNDYNESVEVFNSFAPKFLHYDKVDKMVSVEENNFMTDLRNGVKGADTQASIDDTSFSEDEEDEDIEDLESDEGEEDEESTDTGGWSAESYNELVDEYNELTDGEKMDHVDDDVLDIEYEQLEERVADLK